MKILIMGLPGSGKTTLAQHLSDKLRDSGKTVTWLNADDIREHYNDWDFSTEGRIRQSKRMSDLADASELEYVICDFVAPLPEMRTNFNADFTIWVDTIIESRFADTNKAFVVPTHYNARVTEQNAQKWTEIILNMLGI